MLSSPRPVVICLGLFLLSALLTWTYHHHHHPRSPHTQHPSSLRDHIRAQPRLAIATFLAGDSNPDASKADDDHDDNDDEDGYFLGARVLAYQLLHSAVTGTNLSIPFVVVVTSGVSERKKERLRRDGATVIEVPPLDNGWITPGDARWREVLTKLRLWELTRYDKVCYMDSDTLVTARLDEVFWDESTVLRQSRPPRSAGDRSGPGPVDGATGHAAVAAIQLPRNYMLAAHIDSFGYDHQWPPPEDENYFNAGFFCFRPDKEVFEYYQKVAAVKGSFDPGMPEQNLLNFVHRRDGPMPWARLWEGWNVNWATERDYRNGVKSFHAKFWNNDPTHDKLLKAIWREQRAEMEGYWRGREARGDRSGGVLGFGL